jgi:hypothetical protein
MRVGLGWQVQGERTGKLSATWTDPDAVVRITEVVVDLRLVVGLVEDRQPAQVDVHPSVGVDSVPLDAVFLNSDDGLLGASGWQKATKRGVDIVLAVVSLLILSPLLLVTAVAIKATSPGPAQCTLAPKAIAINCPIPTRPTVLCSRFATIRASRGRERSSVD